MASFHNVLMFSFQSFIESKRTLVLNKVERIGVRVTLNCTIQKKYLKKLIQNENSEETT